MVVVIVIPSCYHPFDAEMYRICLIREMYTTRVVAGGVCLLAVDFAG